MIVYNAPLGCSQLGGDSHYSGRQFLPEMQSLRSIRLMRLIFSGKLSLPIFYVKILEK